MTEITKNITVDLSRRGNTRIVFARQNDKGSRTLNITLTDGGAPYFVSSGTVATINFLRPDGANASFAASVNEQGGVTYTLGLWTLALDGSVRCSVSLYGADETKLTSSDFYLDVLDALYSDDDFSEDFDESDLTGVYSSIASLEAKHETDILVLEDRIAADVDEKISAVSATASTARSDAQTALEIANDVRARADAGEFKGDKGEKGEKGDAGVISFIPVTELPTENIVENAIYLVPAVDGAEPNLFDEYIYTNGAWEKIGNATVSVDMSEYVKKTYVDNGFVAIDNNSFHNVCAYKVYGIAPNGEQQLIRVCFHNHAGQYTIPQYSDKGALYVGTPAADGHAATKKYVDDAIAAITDGEEVAY